MKKMAHIFCIMIAIPYIWGCASWPNEPKPKTISSDLFPGTLQRAEYYHEMAESFSKDGQTDKAIEYGRLALLHNPYNVDFRLQLASDLEKQSFLKEAEQMYLSANQLQENNKNALSALALFYFRQKNYNQSKFYYRNLIDLNPSETKWHWGLYTCFQAENDLAESFDRLNKIKNLSPYTAQVYIEKANLYKKLKNSLKAEENFLKAYELQRGNPETVIKLSELFYQSGRLTEANNILAAFTETNSFNYQVSEQYSFVAVQDKNYLVADNEYNKQLNWTDNKSTLQLKKAHLLFLQSKYQQAKTKYEDLISESPLNEAYYYLALSCAKLDASICYEESLASVTAESDYYPDANVRLALVDQKLDFNRAIDRLAYAYSQRPDSTVLLKDYARYLAKDRQYTKAESVLLKANKSHLKNSEIVLLHAYVKHRLNDTETFKKLVNVALRMAPENFKTYESLAELWYSNSENAADTEFFARTAIQLGSKNPENKMILAWSLFQQNKTHLALPLFEEAYDKKPESLELANHLAELYKWGSVFSRSKEFTDYVQNSRYTGPSPESTFDLVNTESNKRLPASLSSP